MSRNAVLAALALITTLPVAGLDGGQEPGSEAAAILDKAVLAMAPPEHFDRLLSLEYRGQSISLEGEGDPDGGARTEMLMLFPGKVPEQLFMHSFFQPQDGTTFVRTLAGDRSTAESIGLLPADLHRDFVRYASTKLLTILRFRNSPELTAAVVGSLTIGDEIVDLVEVELFGFASVLEVARESGRVQAVRFGSSEIQEGVSNQQVRRAYSDLRQVDGFRLPFLQTVTVGGELHSKWELDEIVVNGEYDAAIFELAD